eukprot:TRINITY_DN22127_c0_g1_i1.p1 TRINITY_DN22127_c0_g1~~TRINITY_DN22127_c0_g1_i1.p1  ORF type:complete len:286 (+),score=52.32 TRINITY_DN22127_c0_g1_i1:67-924(+)
MPAARWAFLLGSSVVTAVVVIAGRVGLERWSGAAGVTQPSAQPAAPAFGESASTPAPPLPKPGACCWSAGSATASAPAPSQPAPTPAPAQPPPASPQSARSVQAIIQAGFSEQRARAAVKELGHGNCCTRHIHWLFKKQGQPEWKRRWPDDPSERVCHIRNHTDYDGYAVVWGLQHKTDTAEECCERCKQYSPRPPDNYPCNVWVWCGRPKCFAPAAHRFTFGQCWLKHQDDPTRPQVNMQGRYDDKYHRRHPDAPEFVDWTAGVVLPAGMRPSDETVWSARSTW